MANNKTTRLISRIDEQEKQIIKSADRLARTVLDGLSVASEEGASDYQKVRALAPLLQQIGHLGGMAEDQIKAHDAMKHLAAVLGSDTALLRTAGDGTDQDGPGRDKD
jgi:phosphomevalonate kinase